MSRTNQQTKISTDRIPSHGISYKDASEEHLLSASRAGDDHAFSELCRRYSHMLRMKIMRIVRHREDTEDVLQESLLKAYQHLDRFRGSCRFQTWLNRIGVNSALMLLRKRRARAKFMVEPNPEDNSRREQSSFPHSAPDPEQILSRMQVQSLMAQSISQLRADWRRLLEDHYGNGFSVEDLAGRHGISVASAKSRMHRARRMLRERLMRHQLASCHSFKMLSRQAS